MRTSSFPSRLPPRFLSCLALAVLASASGANAQVGDAERAAARDLFRQGDSLQREGKFSEALDKFQRAEQVIQAPTNVLRVAECEAALGKLVEAAESFRAVVRWPLPPNAPPAFQSAIDQAKGELAQVEPRVPKLLVQATPAGVANESMVVDGTAVPGALIGEPFPLDPGDHKVLVTAPGYSSAEQVVTLKERETKTLAVDLHPVAGAIVPAPAGSTSTPPPPPAYGSASPSSTPPPPPDAYERAAPPPDHKRSKTSILLGAHLGLSVPTGQLPANVPNGLSVDMGDVSSVGLGYAVDGGLRFARQFYLGLTLEHAAFGAGKNPGNLGGTVNSGNLSSDTTSLGLVGAFILEPERPTFYGEIGLQERWYNLSVTGQPTQSYNSGELLLGVGLWWPIGRWLRLLPLATAGLGSFNMPNSGSANSGGQQSHAFLMFGVEGLYNIEL
jgi:hypothetical protein